jgi:hypothetical protein
MNVATSRVILNSETIIHDESEGEHLEIIDLVTDVRDDSGMKMYKI